MVKLEVNVNVVFTFGLEMGFSSSSNSSWEMMLVMMITPKKCPGGGGDKVMKFRCTESREKETVSPIAGGESSSLNTPFLSYIPSLTISVSAAFPSRACSWCFSPPAMRS